MGIKKEEISSVANGIISLCEEADYSKIILVIQRALYLAELTGNLKQEFWLNLELRGYLKTAQDKQKEVSNNQVSFSEGNQLNHAIHNVRDYKREAEITYSLLEMQQQGLIKTPDPESEFKKELSGIQHKNVHELSAIRRVAEEALQDEQVYGRYLVRITSQYQIAYIDLVFRNIFHYILEFARGERIKIIQTDVVLPAGNGGVSNLLNENSAIKREKWIRLTSLFFLLSVIFKKLDFMVERIYNNKKFLSWSWCLTTFVAVVTTIFFIIGVIRYVYAYF